MKRVVPCALILLADFVMRCLAPKAKSSNKVIGNWKYSHSASERTALAFNEFSLHDEKNAALDLNFILSCGLVKTSFFIPAADERAKITSPVVTGSAGEKFADWKPCSEVEGFECLGVAYQGSSDAPYGHLGEKGQLAFELKEDGQKVAGEGDFKILDALKQDVAANCRH